MILDGIRDRVEEIKIIIKMTTARQKIKETELQRSSALLEKLVYALNEEAKNDKRAVKEKIGRIILGDFDDDESYEKEEELKYLKKKGIIKSYKLSRYEPEESEFERKGDIDDFIFKNDDQTDNADYILLRAECRFSPDKVADFLKTFGKNKKEIASILIVTPTFGKFDYVWIVLNEDYKHKLKASVKNKLNNNNESYAMKLYRLADKGKLTYDKSFWDDVNYSLCKRAAFKNFLKTTILKRFRNEIEIKDGIKIEKICLQQLSKPEADYF